MRDIVAANKPVLLDTYDACVSELVAFRCVAGHYHVNTLFMSRCRAQHVGMARAYIHQFNEQAKGTGGSNVLPALQGYKVSTAKHKMGSLPPQAGSVSVAAE